MSKTRRAHGSETRPPPTDPLAPVRLGPFARGVGFVVRRVDYDPGYRQPPHAHPEHGITLVLAGGFRETAFGREEDASALSVVVKPAGTVHADVVGPAGARTVLVDFDEAAPLLPDPRHLGSWRWIHAGPGVRPLLALRRALEDPGGGPDPEDAVLELLGEVTGVPSPDPGDVPAFVHRAREAVDDLAVEGVRVRELADGVGVHPVSLTRAFRRAYGIPVTVYRRRARLRRAAADVTGTARRLSRIAHATGYADQAHMCREVREATGLTPSGLREMAGD